MALECQDIEEPFLLQYPNISPENHCALTTQDYLFKTVSIIIQVENM
jgi:hypothetical protein